MSNNNTRVRVFYVKNRSTSKDNSFISKDSSNSNFQPMKDLSTFQSQYLTKNRSRQKDVTHLSTLLQRDKVDEFQGQNKKNIQNEITLHQSLKIKQKLYPNDEFLTMFSNQKVNTQQSQNQQENSPNKSETNVYPYKQSINKNFNQSQQKFYTAVIQKKFVKPNNLSSIFKEKWCQLKLKKGQQKIQNVLRTTINFNSHIFEQRQKAKLQQIQLNKISKKYSFTKEKQTNVKIKQNFLNFLEQKKFSFSQPKIKDIKSEKLIKQGKIVYQPLEIDKFQNRVNSFTQMKDSKKIKNLPIKIKKLFDSQPLQNIHPDQQIINKKTFQSKNFSNKMLNKKRKSIFLPEEDHQKVWWSKQEILQKSGCFFDLKKAVII